MAKLDWKTDVPLGPLTTLGLGGEAEHFVRVSTLVQLQEALARAQSEQWKVFVLGGGSNVVLPDQGMKGLTVVLAMKGVTFEPLQDQVLVTAAAGEVWDELVAECIDRGLAGLECLSGIPGLVGASPIQNVGAYGQEVADTILEVQAIEMKPPYREQTFTNEECQFRYRLSRFKERPGDFIITAVKFRLSPGGSPTLVYRDLEDYGNSEAYKALLDPIAKLQSVRKEVLRIRAQKSMVLDPDDPNSRSAGSFFTNPVLTAEEFSDFCLCTGLSPNRVPYFKTPDGMVKVPAAWLVEMAGFKKGMRHGGVGISQAHALALVNHNGTSKELLELAEMIARKVYQQFGLKLAVEPVLVPSPR